MKFFGVKKAVGDAQRLQNTRVQWTVYLNARTGQVWLKEYAGRSNWTEYEDQEIEAVVERGLYARKYSDPIDMKKLQWILERHVARQYF